MIDFRLGDWRTALADVEGADVLISDPPYTHKVMFGYRSGTDVKLRLPSKRKPSIPYDEMTPKDARDLANLAVRLGVRFAVVFNDHVGWRWLERAFHRVGWYVFAPVVWLRENSAPRFQGDGPADACEYLCVARPRGVTKIGSLPGFYVYPIVQNGWGRTESCGLVGQKPLALMRALVRDYSKPGDLIVDPYCGTGTTAIAARAEGRGCITCEIDPETYEKARRRIEHGNVYARNPAMLPLPFAVGGVRAHAPPVRILARRRTGNMM